MLSACRSSTLVITAVPLPSVSPTVLTPTAGEICIRVDGAVQQPGDYTLPLGARVVDAVHAAGGSIAEANLAQINLARTLSAGEHVHVPCVGEVMPTSTPYGRCADGRIDVNQADAALLETLPRIGPVTAQRIVAYRAQYGPFQSVDQIQDVQGIGPATLSQIQALITVGACISTTEP
jgi:competence protein ComEA